MIDRVDKIFLCTSIVGMVLAVLLGWALTPDPDVKPGTCEPIAKAWADRLGIRVTGVQCDGACRCTFGRGDGMPFLAKCERVQNGKCDVREVDR